MSVHGNFTTIALPVSLFLVLQNRVLAYYYILKPGQKINLFELSLHKERYGCLLTWNNLALSLMLVLYVLTDLYPTCLF